MKQILCGLALALLLATPALGHDPPAKKREVDSKIADLHGRLDAQRAREASLRAEIAGVSSRIRTLEAQAGDVSVRLATLEQDLALHNERLDKLNALFRLQSNRLALLERDHRRAVSRLNERLVAIYEAGPVSTLDVLLGARSIEEAIDLTDYMTRIGQLDRQVADDVARSKRAALEAKQQTMRLRAGIAGEIRSIAARKKQALEARDALVGAQASLADTKQHKLVALSGLTAQERAQAAEIDGLLKVSAALGAQIRAAQADNSTEAGRGPVTPSSAGLIWPVSAGVTSPFGWRWGRMHQGIDIAGSTGTPIRAAAAGRVIYCGWEDGYGNLVVLDNGGTLATAYAHQSAIAVTCGQDVGQGQIVGYVGSTGHSTGPHLHFEVRINGNAVDPLGYL